jgi:hypothetical protein
MLTRTIIEKTVQRLHNGLYDSEFTALQLANSGCEDVNALVLKRSSELMEEIRAHADTLEISPHIAEWLLDFPVLWIPSQSFVAEAVKYRADRFIVFSDGLLRTLSFIAEFNIIMSVLYRRQELDKRTAQERSEQDRQLSDLFFNILANQLQRPARAVPLPGLRSHMTDFLLGAALVLDVVPRLFVLLHEIGHLKLGHLGRRFLPKRITIRSEAQVIPDKSNRYKEQEYDADAFAIRQTRENRRQLIFLGAESFFTFLAIFDAKSATHPLAGNRWSHLVQEFEGGLGNRKSSKKALFQQLHGHGQILFSGGKLLPRAREETGSRAATEISAAAQYLKIGSVLLSDVRQRPDEYTSLFKDWSGPGI